MRTILALLLLSLSAQAFAVSTWTETFLELVNQHRESLGLRALEHVSGIDELVTSYSAEMARGAVEFGHTGFSERCSQAEAILGLTRWCGENVAMGQRSPEAVFTAWMNSPGHRENLEMESATHTGFGFALDESGSVYWTQIFLSHLK